LERWYLDSFHLLVQRFFQVVRYGPQEFPVGLVVYLVLHRVETLKSLVIVLSFPTNSSTSLIFFFLVVVELRV
jgi:hypothetical protein